MVPSTLTRPGALRFWLAVLLTGAGAGIGAAALTRLLESVQQQLWHGNGTDLLDSVVRVDSLRRISVLLAAGLLTGTGQIVLRRLSSSNGIDITEAIWFRAGRLPKRKTLGSALLSILVVGMGASLGREGAPKQTGAVIANGLANRFALSDDERRLLVATGAGAGMAAAYGVPLGGALFAVEVLRGKLSLRLVLPALVTSLVATGVSWFVLPNAPTYLIPAYASSASVLVWVLLAGPIAGLGSVGYVRLVALADRLKPKAWGRIVAPVLVLGSVGAVSIWYPQILGNGKDIAQLAFSGAVAPTLLLALLVLKPAATLLCIGSGVPGGLFTPSLSAGALLGGVLGYAWSLLWPGVPPGLFAVLGAAAMLAATTQGPISAIVLMMELTGLDRAFVVPLLLMVALATLIARTIEPRSIYDARLTDAEITERQTLREPPPV